MRLEFLIKLRDGATMIADAAQEQLEKLAPCDVKHDLKDFASLRWETKQGTKASYEQTSKEANNNSEAFQGLQKILQGHNGFWQSSTHKYWIHRDNLDKIDRRKK
jgi:hypothetical protein